MTPHDERKPHDYQAPRRQNLDPVTGKYNNSGFAVEGLLPVVGDPDGQAGIIQILEGTLLGKSQEFAEE